MRAQVKLKNSVFGQGALFCTCSTVLAIPSSIFLTSFDNNKYSFPLLGQI